MAGQSEGFRFNNNTSPGFEDEGVVPLRRNPYSLSSTEQFRKSLHRVSLGALSTIEETEEPLGGRRRPQSAISESTNSNTDHNNELQRRDCPTNL